MDAERVDMGQQRLATLTHALRRVPSRRDILRGLGGAGLGLSAGWLPDAAAAKKKRKKKNKTKKKTATPPCTPKCGRKQCGNDGCGGSCGECAAGQVCRSGTCCTPEPPDVTCAGRCGTVADAICHLPVTCTCPSGQECLSNGSCATACTSSCPGFCICFFADSDGGQHCNEILSCSTQTQTCQSTAECPARTHCVVTDCGQNGSDENRCVPLCNA
jgi:hypothetical protein